MPLIIPRAVTRATSLVALAVGSGVVAACADDAPVAASLPSPEAAPALVWAIDGTAATAARAAALPAARLSRLEIGERDAIAVRTDPMAPTDTLPDRDRFGGVVLVDGVPADDATVAALVPEQVASVSVLQGAAARARSDRPEAALGVIDITTRTAAAP